MFWVAFDICYVFTELVLVEGTFEDETLVEVLGLSKVEDSPNFAKN